MENDALHTCQQSLRKIHQDNGADYLLPVKANHEGLEILAAASLPPLDSRPSEARSSATQQPVSSIQPTAELSPLRAKHGGFLPDSAAAVRYRRK